MPYNIFSPLPHITPYQFVDLVGWSVAAVVTAIILAVAVRRFRWAKRVADNGSPLPLLGILGAVGLVCWWLTSHGPAFPTPQWWHRPIAGWGDLYYGTLLGLLMLLRVAAMLVFGVAGGLAGGAVFRWLCSPMDPGKWGAITGSQRLVIGWRQPRQERRLAETLAAQSSSPKDGRNVYVWWQRVHIPPAEGESLPRLLTWFLIDHGVEDLEALQRSAEAAHTVRVAEAFAQDDITRVRVEWELNALAPTPPPGSEHLGRQRRRAAPVAVIPPDFQGIS